MNLWRLNLKPEAAKSNPSEFCITRNILGIGWSVNIQKKEDITKEEYLELGKDKYGDTRWVKATNAIIKNMKIGDLCWVRHDGNYYLGRVKGEWGYKDKEEYIDADIVNIRECTWTKGVLADIVPGKVVNSFIPPSTVQRVNDKAAKKYSMKLYNQLIGEEIYKGTEFNKKDDIFSILSSDDCEDLMYFYLQNKYDYILIPSTCKNSTQKYEFTMINKKDGHKAVVQVKNGNVDLNTNDFLNINADIVYLFTTKGKYTGEKSEKVICINREDILNFIETEKILPPRIENIINMFFNDMKLKTTF